MPANRPERGIDWHIGGSARPSRHNMAWFKMNMAWFKMNPPGRMSTQPIAVALNYDDEV